MDRDPLNLVTVLERERSLELEAAYQAAVEVYHADLDRFNAASEALVAAPDAAAVDRGIARGLSEWVHGNCVWTRTSGRYRHTPKETRTFSLR